MAWPRTPPTGAIGAARRLAGTSASRTARSRHPRARARSLASALTVALAVGISLAGTPDVAGAAAAVAPAAVVEGLEEAECPVEVPRRHADRVTCGVLVVPERRTAEADPEKTLSLPVAIIASRNRDPQEDPLVFPTGGGPGAGSLSALGYFLDYGDWASNERDIILVEQRGDALAEPTLDCPELDLEHFVVDDALLGGAEADERYTEQLAACHARLVEEGNDLAAYTSAESVVDLADLRTALGYDEWNLYGVSYGARLAMTVMRDRPEGLRSVILDGAFPPDINRYELVPSGFLTALDALFSSCAADVACDESYPDLEASLTRVLDSAAETPIPVVVKNPADGSPLRVTVDDTDLTQGLYNALYDANSVRVLPYLIDQLSRGNTAGILPLVQQNIDFTGYFTEGLDLSVDCAEEVPFNDDARIAEAMAADPILEHFEIGQIRADCAAWAVPALSAIENQAVASEIPTLLTSGGYDPVTPLAFSEVAAAQLSLHHLYEFPTMGHGSVWQNWIDDCPASIAEQFLREPATEPDSSCIAAMPPTDFLTTDDIYATTAIYRFNSDVVEDRDPVQIGIAVITLAVLFGTLVYAAIYGIAWLIRRRGSAPAGAVLAAAVASGLYLAFTAGLAYMMLTGDPLVLGFGIAPAIRPLVIAPLIAMAVTVLLTVVVVRAWIGGDGTLFHRVALSVAAAASVGYAVWLVARGLLIF